ncbi:MAG: cellulose biosynthesis cyclic di-GMP-binding regulatory protein BcsB [Halothiobacillaceae bacterium]|jgi:hypothetical protein|nr:cellulose biosynthesis cyclic di-GMP-binding regulatory protein BcsB [Halothiobacillaceae bacterium]
MSRLSLRHTLIAAFLTAIGTHTVLAQGNDALRIVHDESDYTIPLGWLNGGGRAPIELRGADARYAMKLPIPQRLAIEEGKLEMVYTNSISLIPRSQLAVTLNERVLAQLPVKADEPDHAARITLPLEGLRPGYRDLGFRAAQHYTLECEDPSAPELYSQVDAVQSVLRLKVKRRALAPSLARLGDVFDRKLWLDRYALQLMVPTGGLESHEDMRQAAAQISQSIANIFDYLPVSVQVHELRAQGATHDPHQRFYGVQLSDGAWDGILLGTRDQLAPFLSESILAQIKEGYIGLFPSDQDASRYILVISGTTPAEVREAATVLNLPGIALPDRQDISISELRLDQGFQRTQPAQIDKGWISFANLGFRTLTMKGMYAQPARLEFWAFREMLDPARPFIELQLNYAYGAGFDKKSALNVMLNGNFVQALPLQDLKGEQIFRAKVRIPTIALRPGVNELQFMPTVTGIDLGGACQPLFTENLLVSIFEDSRIELPPISDYMRLPDLGLFGKTGLPYTRLADGLGIGVMVGDMKPETLGSALTLIAKLRQTHKGPLTSLRFLSSKDATTGLDGLIVVGSAAALPEAIREEMTAFLPAQRWQTVGIGTRKSTDIKEGAKRWLDQPLAPFMQLAQVNDPATGELILSEGLGRSAALVQYVSKTGNTPVTVLTAADPTHLLQGASRLVEHTTWGMLDGSALLWSMNGEAVARAESVHHEFVGEAPAINPMSYLISDRPWQAALAVLILIGLLAGLAWWLLRARARRLRMED